MAYMGRAPMLSTFVNACLAYSNATAYSLLR